MAKKATSKGATRSRPRSTKTRPPKTPARARRATGGGGAQDTMGEAFIKLMQSPLVADLVAVAATAALAALAEQGFSSRGDHATRGKRAGRAVKAAGQAAAAAVGRRLNLEIEEIRKASKQA